MKLQNVLQFFLTNVFTYHFLIPFIVSLTLSKIFSPESSDFKLSKYDFGFSFNSSLSFLTEFAAEINPIKTPPAMMNGVAMGINPVNDTIVVGREILKNLLTVSIL